MSTTYSSNLDSLMEAIRSKVLGFGFQTPSSKGSGTVGDHAASVVATGIHNRSEQGRGPDDDWDRNAKSTIKKKGFDKPNFETGATLSVEELTGTVESNPDECRMKYGQTQECREKAHWAHVGQSKRKIIRKFYELDGTIRREVCVVVRDELGQHLSKD